MHVWPSANRKPADRDSQMEGVTAAADAEEPATGQNDTINQSEPSTGHDDACCSDGVAAAAASDVGAAAPETGQDNPQQLGNSDTLDSGPRPSVTGSTEHLQDELEPSASSQELRAERHPSTSIQQDSSAKVVQDSPIADTHSASDADTAALSSSRIQSASRLSSSVHVSRSSSQSTRASAVAAADTDGRNEIAAQISNALLHVLSSSAIKRANLHVLDDGALAIAAGCAVLFLQLPSMQQRFLPGRDGGGVAAVAVHPSRKLFLVAEKCRSRPPNM